jgi:hypothetical protein
LGQRVPTKFTFYF